MKIHEFSELHKHNCALIDASSVEVFCDPVLMEMLSGKVETALRPVTLAEAGIARAQVADVLDILSRFVVYDFVCVDRVAWRSCAGDRHGRQPPRALSPIVTETAIGDRWYELAARTVLAFGDASGLKPFDHKQRHVLRRNLPFWDLCDKMYHDNLTKALIPHLRRFSWISHSDKSAARVLFYLELARLARVPVFLCPWKRRFLTFYRDKIVPECLRLVETIADKYVFMALSKVMHDVYDKGPEFELPPLANFIVTNAKRKGLSVIDSTLEVRDALPAREFRIWAKEVQDLLMSGDRSKMPLATRRIQGLMKYVQQWAENADANAGVRYKTRGLALKYIPAISGLLKMASMDRVKLKDPILTCVPGYVGFVADWYRT
jgi:hypothetical protein